MTHDNATDIVEALHRHAFDDCGGFAGIIDNHVATEAAREIATLRKQLENAREVITEANNSLYGSQSYFLSLDGGPPNKYHLAEGIEKLKSNARLATREALKGQPC